MNMNNWLLLLLLSFLWGGSFFFVEVALTELPIFTIVFLRVSMGAAILFVFILMTNRRIPRDRKMWFNFLVMGILNNVIPFCMITGGQQFISGGFASILISTTPFFGVVVAHLLTKDERINAGKILGVVLGLSGVSILIGFAPLRDGSNEFIGIIAVLGAALSYAFAGVWGKRFRSLGVDSVVIAAGQLICSTILLIPIMSIADKPWLLPVPSINVWGSVLGIALLSTSFAYIIYFKILSTSGATKVLLVTFLIPVSANLLGVLILSEEFHIQHLLGMFVIGIGLIVMDASDRVKISQKEAAKS